MGSHNYRDHGKIDLDGGARTSWQLSTPVLSNPFYLQHPFVNETLLHQSTHDPPRASIPMFESCYESQ
jgi:hypothetical protein